MVCTQVAGTLHLVDVLKGTEVELYAHQFFQHPFDALTNSKNLVEYYVVEVTKIGKPVGQYQLADCQIIKSEDFGVTEDYLYVKTIFGKTIFGNTIREGETALGYDLVNLNANNDNFESYQQRGLEEGTLPEVILIGRGHL
ncbi:nonsense-mediated mRNA decay protein, putative [Entamoeba histolytica KU27]|uniref:Nonsense-mediated mRNA decay protein, putative n=1 Tax=Entamoeba histolytica KU27 TaxID=885311 RepID=M2R3H9_ENTHI|nr:nonsense-mediated mRNA decay protein, putative [Entamoeba histolytica KU27]